MIDIPVGATCFDNNEWMINISIVGLVGKYWNVVVDGNTGKILSDCEFNSDCQDCNQPHQYCYLPDYLNQLLDRLSDLSLTIILIAQIFQSEIK